MRFVFITVLLLVLSPQLSAKSQIILGTFSKKSSSLHIKSKIEKLINKDLKLKSLLEKKNIKATTKENGKYFLVTLEPFTDKDTLNIVRKKLKDTYFSDNYVVKLSEVKEVKEIKKTPEKKETIKTKIIEPKHKEVIIIEQNTKPVDIKKKEIKIDNKSIERVIPIQEPIEKQKQVQKPIIENKTVIKNENIVKNYLYEIIAFIAALIIFVAYLFKIKNKTKDDLKTTNEDLDEIEEENVEEIIEVDKYDTPNPKSDVVKKEVPFHEKISKKDFKQFAGVRLMIAEDNLINQKVIKGLLVDSGIKLTILNDGKEVLDYLENDDKFSMILMDVHMPNIDGYEATKSIRSNPKYSHITVVALSGDISSEDVLKMREAGMQESLEKPLNIDALYDVLYAYTEINNELNIELGLEVCGGDAKFYKEILNDFLVDYKNSVKEIQDYLDDGELDIAQKLIFDVSSVTANIGAKNIQDTLKELKLSIKNSKDKEYLEVFKKFSKHYEELLKEVKKYLS